jgi:hypothetical protein
LKVDEKFGADYRRVPLRHAVFDLKPMRDQPSVAADARPSLTRIVQGLLERVPLLIVDTPLLLGK